MKVTFVARAIDGMAGGVERMVTTVMNALVARGHSVSLLTWDKAEAVSFYPMSPEITWYQLDLGNASVKAGKLLKLRRAVAVRKLMRWNKTDIIVCFQDGPFIALRAYTAGMGIPVIAAERNAPTRFDHTSAARRQNLTYNALRFAKRILVQCESYRVLYPVFLHKRIVTIPNPVFTAIGYAQPELPNADGRFRILSVGRLSYQKNYPVLVEAFAAVASTFPEWDLVLVGDGDDRAKLEGLIAEKGLANRISMPGTSASVSNWYISSHLFCLASRWEGFPNALAEALAHGLPSVGFAGCAGVRDLISSGENGLLAEGNGDPKTFAKTLEMLMGSVEERQVMGINAAESVKCYVPDEVFSLWEQILTEAAMP